MIPIFSHHGQPFSTHRGPSLGRLAAQTALLLSAATAWAQPTPPPTSAAALTAEQPEAPDEPPARWLDGGRWQALRRLDQWTHDRQHGLLMLDDGRQVPVQFGAAVILSATAPSPAQPEIAPLRAYGVQTLRPLSAPLGLWLAEGAPLGGPALATRLSEAIASGQLPGWAEAVPDLWRAHRAQAMSIPPNDPRYTGQWFLQRVEIERAWAISTGAPDVTVLVIDTGCTWQHPDLAADYLGGYDAVDRDDDPSPHAGHPGDYHGTAVAGVAAAVSDNGEGIAGACPECTWRCVRLLREDGRPVPLSADVAAFDYALSSQADVINNSWGFSVAQPVPAALARAITAVATVGGKGRGALVVFAAGNDAREILDDELLALEGVIGVGATNDFDELTQYSNFGRAIDVVAPTGSLTTDLVGAAGEDPGDYTARFGGTSSSAPLVSGVLALMVAAAPDQGAAQITAALIETAQQSFFAQPDAEGHDMEYGWGVIRPERALRQLLGLPEDAPDAGPPEADATVADAQPDTDGADAAPEGADAQSTEAGKSSEGGCQQSPGPSHSLGLFAGLALLARRRRTRAQRT